MGNDEMLHAMKSRVPGYLKSKESIDAYLKALDGISSVFTWAPPNEVDGGYATLTPGIEDRVRLAVVKELKKCRKEIEDHLSRLRALEQEQSQ